MSGTWDGRALAWLRGVRDTWGAAGVLGLLEDAVAQVWERNLARHDPVVAGDTAVSLGITSAENLRTLLLRAAPEWEPRGVLLGAPWNSLVVTYDDVALHLMKAPDGSPGSPDFAALRWAGEVRAAAAAANGALHAPAAGDRTAGQLWFDGFEAPPVPGGVRLGHVVLVWTGDALSATTAGWLAVPWERDGEPAWLAALPVWAHGPEQVPAPRAVPAVSVSFSGAGPGRPRPGGHDAGR